LSSSVSLREPRRRLVPALAILSAAAAGALLGLASPGAAWVVVAALVVLPIGALVLAGPARAATVAASLAYVAALIWIYRADMVPVWAYAGMIDARPSATDVLVVTGIAVLPAMWIPVPARRASTIVLWVVYLMGYLPAVVLPPFLGAELGTVLRLDLALLGSMALVALILRVPVPRIDVRPMSATTFTRLLTVTALLGIVYMIAGFGLHGLPSVTDVYETRDAFKSAVGGIPGGSYLIGWATGVIYPLLMAWGIARRRPALVILSVLAQLLVYSVTGYKAALFSIVFVPLVYMAVSHFRRSFGLLLSVGVPAILVLSALPAAGNTALGLASRMYVLPAQLTYYYYEYFSIHPQYELSHSFLRWFSTRPYSQEPPDLIGSVYFPGTGTHANAGLWADAYANFGFGGIFAFTVVFGLVLWAADGVSRNRDMRIVGALLGVAALAINSGAVFTAILTNGIALSLLLILFMPPVPEDVRRPVDEEEEAGPPEPRGVRLAPLPELPTRIPAGAMRPDARAAPALPAPAAGRAGRAGPHPAGPVLDLNTATAAELYRLPGIGFALAARIVRYREEHGAYTSLEELLDIPGLGAARLRAIEGSVTV
jgi:competence ComEA-like helix-hairpin-helix protein